MVGWYQHLNGHEFEQASGDGEGQGSLECCGPWGCKESDTTEQLNNSNKLSLSCLRRSKSTKPPYIVETRSLAPSFLAVSKMGNTPQLCHCQTIHLSSPGSRLRHNSEPGSPLLHTPKHKLAATCSLGFSSPRYRNSC